MIADDTIDRVRREARIVAIVGERVKLTKRGRSYVGLCPFHKEKTPSFHVNEERGFYHCFGCAASGDAIKFVREVDGLSFVDAVRAIAERQGIEVVETGSDDERRQHAEARRRRNELFSANEAAALYFERMLSTHPFGHHAATELRRRGLDAVDTQVAEALKAFRIGYAPYGWDGLSRHLRESGFELRAAETVGLVVPRKRGPGYYDRFRHRLMFAIVDLDGKIVGFSGRSLTDPSDAELRAAGLEPATAAAEPPAKYVNSPESPIYKKREAVFGLWQARQAIRRDDRAVLVEGNFDVVSLHARGVANVVAPLGTAFTLEQAKQIRRFTQRVTLLFDGDSAGRRAALAAREPCRDAALLASVASLPDGRDPDDVARDGGAEAIGRFIKSAKSLIEYLIESTLDGTFAAADAEARAGRIRQITELLKSEDDPAIRALAERHADAIAERLGIGDARTFRTLASLVQRAILGGSEPKGAPQAAPPERARSRQREEEIGLEVFGSILDFPVILDSPEISAAIGLVDAEPAIGIAAVRQNPELTQAPELLLAKLPLSIHPFAAARLAAPRHQSMDDAKAELLGNVEKLQRLELSRQKSGVIEELARMQAFGDFDRELALLGEQARRARERHRL
jgi:DNA primase